MSMDELSPALIAGFFATALGCIVLSAFGVSGWLLLVCAVAIFVVSARAVFNDGT